MTERTRMKMVEDRPELLTMNEAAELLGCSRQNVEQLCDKGELPNLGVLGRTVASRRTERAAVEARIEQLERQDGVLWKPDGWLSTSEVADAAGAAERTVRGWIADDLLAARRLDSGRWVVDPEALAAFMAAREEKLRGQDERRAARAGADQ